MLGGPMQMNLSPSHLSVDELKSIRTVLLLVILVTLISAILLILLEATECLEYYSSFQAARCFSL